MTKTSTVLAVLITASAAGRAQVPAQSAPISGVAYRVTYKKETAASRIVRSEMSFDVAGPAPVVLSLPSWTPGEYEIHNFARNISSFAAKQGGRTSFGKRRIPTRGAFTPSAPDGSPSRSIIRRIRSTTARAGAGRTFCSSTEQTSFSIPRGRAPTSMPA